MIPAATVAAAMAIAEAMDANASRTKPPTPPSICLPHGNLTSKGRLGNRARQGSRNEDAQDDVTKTDPPRASTYPLCQWNFVVLSKPGVLVSWSRDSAGLTRADGQA